ncbi:PHD finger protein 20 isoform X3 [Pelobates fuscus]|uniref:PHD finger protein 20 isoform X3 n=1 Tax=Pelobates fuscus TaxID=191477 RepID=UPI002FE4716B
MTKNPPNRRGIAFEVGAQLEARDRLKKWYAAHIEEIDYEEGKVLIHFKRWNHRYDEWFCWDSPYLRPLEKIQLRREGLVEEEPQVVFRVNEQVLACWSDCRFYPAKITAVNKDGTYTVKFFDGVVQTVKNIHVKAFSKDQTNLSRSKPREKGTENSPSDKHRGKFREQKKTENTSTEKEKSAPDQKPSNQSEKEKKQLAVEKNKPPEKTTVKNEKEDKENISENERDPSADGQCDERSVQNDSLKVPHENGDRRRKRNKPSSSPPSVSSSQTLQPVTLELRRRRISIGSEVQTKRPRLDKSAKKNVSVDEKIDEKNENGVSGDEQKPSDICENGENDEKSVLHLSNGVQENLNVMEETPAPPAVQEESSQELESGHTESEVQTETLPATSPELSETKESCQLENPGETAAADISTSPSDDKPEEKMQSMQNDTQEADTVTAAMKRNPRSDHSAKYSREPLTNTLKKTDNPAPKAVSMELDPNRFKCKFLDCSKSFRKAKLLHYHMKYFHGVEKAEHDQSTVTRHMQTRGSLAHEKASQDTTKRRRTTSGSLHTSLQLSLRSSPQDKLNERRRHSTPASNSTHSHRPSLREKSKENEIQKAHRKPERLSDGVNDKEKTKEKSKDLLNLKSKKKKKKKKRSKSELSGSEENIDISKELSPKKSPPSKPNNDYKAQCPLRNPPLRSSDHGRRRDTAKLSDEDTLSDSCTESLLWSDDDYNEEIDVTNADEDLEEEEEDDDDDDDEEGDCEIVRCMCEVQEENDFMIQCEDCLCWQHGVCMGLLEDNVPEKYTCYVCQDPPGQRLSLKYWYDKDWMNEGHMHGLSFLEENYSHQNAKKIVATHQLLGDVQRVIEVLHGLRLKISILQSKEHPDLKFWGQPWKHVLNEKCYMRRNLEEKSCKEDTTNYRTYNGAVDKPSPIPSVEESYITSEHCYQKPRTYYPAVEQRLVVETRNSTLDAGVERIRQSREDSLAERLGWELDRELIKTESESKHNYCKVRECLTKRNPPPESSQPFDNGDTTVNTQLQWQLNLLAHLESLQDEVTHRMDFIEKELDVLESFLDYTGELEPPEPLARLPQLKHRIKQLLTDLGKVEQIALCCST